MLGFDGNFIKSREKSHGLLEGSAVIVKQSLLFSKTW